MRKIKAWQHSRKLALGIAFALGCSMGVSASAQVINAPITGDAAVDTAYKDFVELKGSTPYYVFDKDVTIKVDSSVNTPLQFTANGNTYDVAAGIAAMSTKAMYMYLNPNGSTLSMTLLLMVMLLVQVCCRLVQNRLLIPAQPLIIILR